MDGARDLANEVYTVTFGDQGENEPGMQMFGKPAEHGMSVEHLDTIASHLKSMGAQVELLYLTECAGLTKSDEIPHAAVLVVKDGVNRFTGGNKLPAQAELAAKVTDKKAFMYGAVKDKNVRHNFLFGTCDQAPDYASKKGTIYNFVQNITFDGLRRSLSLWAGIKDPDDILSVGEVNHYYDVSKTYISFHGDAERKVVIGCRFGKPEFPLWFRLHDNGRPVGQTVKIDLGDGDVYFMSELAVGQKWKSKGCHWRHAAGQEGVVPASDAMYEKKQRAKDRKAAKKRDAAQPPISFETDKKRKRGKSCEEEED